MTRISTIFHLLFGSALCIVLLPSCGATNNLADRTFTGKVVGGICSQYTIELVSGKMDADRYVAEWKHPNNDSTYHKVFTISNYCYFSKLGLQKGDIFRFRLLPDKPKEDCVMCLAYEPGPDVHNTIEVIHSPK